MFSKPLSPSYMSYPRLRCSRTTLWRIMFATPGPAAVGGQWLWTVGSHEFNVTRSNLLQSSGTLVSDHMCSGWWLQSYLGISLQTLPPCTAKCPVIPSNHISFTIFHQWELMTRGHHWLKCDVTDSQKPSETDFTAIFDESPKGEPANSLQTTIDQNLAINGSIDSKAKLHPVKYDPVPIWFSYVSSLPF